MGASPDPEPVRANQRPPRCPIVSRIWTATCRGSRQRRVARLSTAVPARRQGREQTSGSAETDAHRPTHFWALPRSLALLPCHGDVESSPLSSSPHEAGLSARRQRVDSGPYWQDREARLGVRVGEPHKRQSVKRSRSSVHFAYGHGRRRVTSRRKLRRLEISRPSWPGAF